MTPDYKMYHGAVFVDLIDSFGEISIRPLLAEGRQLNYVINNAIGLQLKYATQRLHPWHFSFPPSHVESLDEMQNSLGLAFLILVCKADGIVAVPATLALPQLRNASGAQAWLRADRKRRGRYRLYGPAGEFPEKFLTTVEPVVEALRDSQQHR